jgi:hypothetical protein
MGTYSENVKIIDSDILNSLYDQFEIRSEEQLYEVDENLYYHYIKACDTLVLEPDMTLQTVEPQSDWVFDFHFFGSLP